MRLLVDEATPMDQDHLVHAVGKLIAPVLDVNSRRCMRDITAVHIGVSWHAVIPAG
jgi:hypothetical protein